MFENLGSALMLLRELRGVSQAKIARDAGMGKSQISKYERSKELPKLESLEKILKILGVGSFEFFYTLRLVDQRAASIGSARQVPRSLEEIAPAIFEEASGSILHPETHAAFQSVSVTLLRLYAHVLKEVLLGRLNETSPGGKD